MLKLLWLITFVQLSAALSLNGTAKYPLTLLLTSTVSPTLYHVDPFRRNQIIDIIDIPRTTGLLGIAELEKDVFYVASSNLSSVQGVPGSSAVWRVDMRDSHDLARSKRTKQTIKSLSLVANITSAQLLNGMCRLADDDPSTLLIADSQAGKIFKLNTSTGSFQKLIDEEVLENSRSGLQVAANGIHVRGSYLYFTNLNQGIFGRFPISLSTGIPTGPVEIIAREVQGDDFAVSEDGKFAWIAMNGQSSLIQVDIEARSARVVVKSADLASASAVSFGRTVLDQESLYVSSAGLLNTSTSTNNTATGGIVARIDLR